MRKNPFRKYRGFFKGEFLNLLAFRFEILIWALQGFLNIGVMVFLWLAIYKENGGASINGFTYLQMITYLVMSALTSQWVTNGVSFHEVGRDISQGNIAVSLTKPVSYRGKSFFSTLGGMVGNFILFFLPAFLVAEAIFTFGLGLPFPQWSNLLLYLVAGLAGVVISDSFDFLLAQLGFVTNSLFGIMLIKNAIFSFLSGGLIPFTFFPAWAQSFLSYLPFSGLASTPVNILLGRYDLVSSFIYLGVAVGWAIALYLASVFANRQMIKHVESAGG